MEIYNTKRDIMNIWNANGVFWFAIISNVLLFLINVATGSFDIISAFATVIFLIIIIAAYALFKKEKAAGLYIIIILYIVDTIYMIALSFSTDFNLAGLGMRAVLIYFCVIAIKSMKDLPEDVDPFATIQYVKQDKKIRRKNKIPHMTKANKVSKEKPVFLADIVYRDGSIGNKVLREDTVEA